MSPIDIAPARGSGFWNAPGVLEAPGSARLRLKGLAARGSASKGSLKVKSTEVHNWGGGINLIYPPSHLDQSGGSGTVRSIPGGFCVVFDEFRIVSGDPEHEGNRNSELEVKQLGCPTSCSSTPLWARPLIRWELV